MFSFLSPRRVVFGAGALAQKGAEVAELLGPRILLVSDRGLLASGLVEQARAVLPTIQDAFLDVEADPSEATCLAAANAARAIKATGVLGFGGGSPLDVAKIAALLAGGDQSLAECYGIHQARGPRLPLVLAPTTAGTGSEATPLAIITCPDAGGGVNDKKAVSSPWLLPDAALIDPDLTLGLPGHVTAATGIDAMVHAIEAFTTKNPNANPMSRVLAMEAMRLLGRSIERAFVDGRDRAARADMALGAHLAGQAFANAPVAAVHALAYPIGTMFHVPHGNSNSLVLPEVLRFNTPIVEGAYRELAAAAFPGREGDLADLMADLSARMAMPTRLRDVGIGQAALDPLAEGALRQTRLLINNPREVTLADARAIYEAVW